MARLGFLAQQKRKMAKLGFLVRERRKMATQGFLVRERRRLVTPAAAHPDLAPPKMSEKESGAAWSKEASTFGRKPHLLKDGEEETPGRRMVRRTPGSRLLRKEVIPTWGGEDASDNDQQLLDGLGRSRAAPPTSWRRRAEWWEVPRVEKRAAFKRYPDSWPQLKSLGSAAGAALAALKERRSVQETQDSVERQPRGEETADPQSLLHAPDPFLAVPDPYTLTAESDPLLVEMARRGGPGVVL